MIRSRTTTPALIAFALVVPFSVTACSRTATPTHATAVAALADYRKFGGPVSLAEPVVPVSQLLADPQRHDGRTINVEGMVVEVCQNSGCWMTFRDGDREMRIRFKDYAFFVPKDCAGKRARVAGTFEVKDVPADEAKHYLEDAGKHEEAEKITGPVPSFTFMASGVLIEP